MAAVNPQLLRTLSELWRTRGDASVTIDSGRVQRIVHVERGEVVAVESGVLTERIGVQLAAEGKLDPVLLTPLVRAARNAGRSFCQQLVHEKLLEPEEISEALHRQFTTRFDRSLHMPGTVVVNAKAAAPKIVRQPIAAAVVASFRRLPEEVPAALVAEVPPHHPPMREDLFSAEQLDLQGDEPRYFRQLAAGMDASGVLDRAQNHDSALRLCAAMVALGAIQTEQVDPVAQYVRSA